MFSFIIFIGITIILFKPLLRLIEFLLLVLAIPFLMIYFLFIPDKRMEVLMFFKVLSLPVLILFLPFIMSYKKYSTQPTTALSLMILWSLVYLIFAIDIILSF